MLFRTLILSLFFAFAVPGNGNSQKGRLPGDEDLVKAQCSIVEIQPSTTNAIPGNLSFSHIKVVDERFLNSSSGYFHASKTGNLFKICHQSSLKDEIAAFITSYFKEQLSPQGDTLFVQIKRCWIRNYELLQHDSHTKPVLNGIDLNLEFYLLRGSCNYALYRFDSTLVENGKSEQVVGKLISKGLLASLKKLERIPNIDPQKRKCITAFQIDSFNNIYRRQPILTEKAPRKGVYLSCDEFRNNTPAFEDFTIDIKSTADILYVKARNLKDSVITDALLFSDGKDMYARLGQNFYPIYKCGDNFEFYGSYQLQTGRSQVSKLLTPNQYAGTNMTLWGLTMNALQARGQDPTGKTQLWTIDFDSGKLISPLQSYYNSLQSP
jgi:hypothetical protein